MAAPVPLQPADRAILDLECETIVGHTCKVVRIAPGAPGIEAVRARIGGRIGSTPELARRLEDGELPAWVPAGAFDLEQRVVERIGAELDLPLTHVVVELAREREASGRGRAG